MKKKIAIVKRVLAVLCVLALLFNNLPQTILATEPETENEQPVEGTETPENTEEPTETPTETPTLTPTETPTSEPTEIPTPTETLTPELTETPTLVPTDTPTPTETPTPELKNPPIPGSTEGSPLDAPDNVEINIVKTGTTTAENLVVGKSDATKLQLSVNVKGAESASVVWAAADGTAKDEKPAAKAGAVTLSNADTDTVTITSNAGWQGGLVDVTATGKYMLDGQEKTKSATVPVEVWTNRGIKIAVKTTAGDIENKTAEMTSTLAVKIESVEGADGSIAGVDTADTTYKYLWSKRSAEKNEQGKYTYEPKSRSKTYIPTETGVYRIRVSAAEDSKSLRNKCVKYAFVTMVKIPARLIWTPMSRPYDGTKTFKYNGGYTLIRLDNGSTIAEDVSHTTIMSVELIDSEVGDYTIENLKPAEGTDLYKYLTANYEIGKVEPVTLTITASTLNPTITVPSKVYDGTTKAEGDNISINWNAANLDTSRFSLVTGEDNHVLTAEDLQLSSAGNVEKETTVSVTGPEDIRVAINGSVTPDYTASVTYEDTVITTTTFEESTVSLKNAATVNEVKWVKDIPVTVEAEEDGLLIAPSPEGPFEGKTASVNLDETENTVKAYIQRENGDIGAVEIRNVKADGIKPEITATVNQKTWLVIFKKSTMVCAFSDGESGLNTESLYYYMVEPSENEPKFDESKWTKLTATESNGKYTAEIDLNEGLNKTVYVRALDKVGNETIKAFARLIIEGDRPNAPTLTDKSEEGSANSRKIISVSVADAKTEKQTASKLMASGIQRVEYALLKDGEDVTQSQGISIENADGLTLSSGSVQRNTDPKSEEDVANCASMAFDLVMDMKNIELEGSYTLKVTAFDYCGNSSSNEIVLSFDTQAPRVYVTMTNGNEVNGIWYYKADNCGIKVTFEDDALADGTYKAAVRKQGQGAKFKDAEISGTSAEVVFSPAEVAELGDGICEVVFEAVDALNNKAKGFTACEGAAAIEDNNRNVCAQFVLDMTAPQVTEVTTTPSDSFKTDTDESKNVKYYSESFTTQVKVNDGEIMNASKAVPTFDIASWTEYEKEAKVTYNNGNPAYVYFTVENDGKYEPFKLYGADYAGNTVVVSDQLKADETDTWENIEDGVCASYRTELDTNRTMLKFSYYKVDEDGNHVSIDKAYVDGTTAYYNTDIVAELEFTNCEKEDLRDIAISISKDGEITEQYSKGALLDAASPLGEIEKEDGSVAYMLNIPVNEDGAYRFIVSGEDRAGGAMSISEWKPTGDEEGDREKEVKDYTTHYTLIRDTTNPRLVSLVITPKEGVTYGELNKEHGNRYYFNKGFDIEATIEGDNLSDSKSDSKIRFARAEDKSEANSEELTFEDISAFSVNINKADYTYDEQKAVQKAVFKDTVNEDGVYAYAVYGTDLAGNPLTYDAGIDHSMLLSYAEQKTDTVSGDSVDGEAEALISRYIVLDTQAPKGTLIITVDKEKTDENGNISQVTEKAFVRKTWKSNPEYSMPYQIADTAAVELNTYDDIPEEERERTPVKVSLDIREKNGTSGTVGSNGDYVYHGALISRISEKMIFWLKEGSIEDLAGNCSKVNSRKIYLDKEQANDSIDAIAPVINVVPVIRDNDYNNQGMPLYNKDVEFEVSVIEPYSEAAGVAEQDRVSSGLNSVKWKVVEKTDEKSVYPEDGQLYQQSAYISEGGKEFADDEQLLFAYAGKVTVPANDVTNRNDLCIIVTAVDNAGNARSTSFDFGIDMTPPSYTVTYDNNNAKGGKYFDASRTATITVHERNFNPENAVVDITTKNWAGAEGSLPYTDSGWSSRQANADTPNGDNDTLGRTIEFTSDGEYTLNVRTDAEGKVHDIAENAAEVIYEGDAPTDFVIDKEAPTASIIMDDNSVQPFAGDGKYYYRADNCGFRVVFSDNGRALSIPDGSPAVFSASISDGPTKYYPADGSDNTLFFSAEEIAALDDGEYVITVTAIDSAGNGATALGESSGCIIDELTGSFVLDKAAPKVTGISTTTENASTSDRLYTDTNSVYYSDSVNVVVTVEEEYASVADFKGISMKTAADADKAEEYAADVAATDNGFTYSFAMDPNNHYGELKLTGCDRAGNKLELAGNYSRNENGNDDLKADDSCIVSLHGKTIDTENPTANIAYRSEDFANMYGDEAYYNKNITAEIAFADNFEIDPYTTESSSEALIGVSQTFSPDGSAARYENVTEISLERGEAGRKFENNALTLTEEGHYSYTLKGADRAGNPIVVTEMKPWTDSVKEDIFEEAVTGETFNTKYELVLDKTAPVFTLSVSSLDSTNKNLQNGRYYFNKAYTATVKVSEVNFDAKRISVKRGAVTNGAYDSSAVQINSYGVTVANSQTEDSGSATYNYIDSVSADGVYRYAVFGSDKAGNALVAPAGSYNLETTDTSAVDLKAEETQGSLETTADISNHIVVDTVTPSGTISIMNQTGTEYYRMLTNGNVEKAEPYRREQAASVNFAVDEAGERTPVRIDYTVEAQPASKSQSGSSEGFVYNNKKSIGISGRQQFKVSGFTLTDLAGNTVTVASKNYIYLDQESPSQDRLAPVTTIRATAPASVRDGRGQDLYNGDVTLSLKITDPYGGQSSAGLAEIYYEIYVNNGQKIEADTTTLHAANTEYRTVNYTDPNLDYTHEQQVTIPAVSHNYNDIRFVVTARDNAGNESTNEYRFGIDITPPAIRVDYDNNDVQNEKYFKADRVATITVTERNFNETAMNIATQAAAGISGWTHNLSGTGNGDGDTWICQVAYRTDGNYTFSVSGADLLGWQAGTPEYYGSAPQDFVLDKTAPVLAVSYDNNDVANGKYYKADRTATLTVSDVNFQGTTDVTVQASGGGNAPGVSFSGMSASLPFTTDGVYSFGGTVTDMAGNVSNRIDEAEFVIDKTLPEIEVSGVEDLSANAEALTITLTMSDVNMNENSISVVLRGTNRGEVDAKGQSAMTGNGVNYVFVVDEDDYYRLEYTATDLAGNSVTKSISFSENQNGTVFQFLGNVQENGYSLERFRPEYLLTNVDEITILSVTLNGQEVPYTYANDHLTFNSDLPSDGKYVITVDVTDAAGNMRSDRQEFIVDTKAPNLTVMGLSKDALYFEEFVITLRRESLTDTFLEIWMDGEELTEGTGAGHYSVGENGDVYITVNEYKAHELYVKVRDEAGNITLWPEQEERVRLQILSKAGIAARTVTQEMKPYEFRLTNSILLRWYSNKPVFFVSLAAIAALFLILILIFKRRKDEEEEKKEKQA